MLNTFSLVSDEELVRMTLRERSSFGFLIERYEAKLQRYINRLGVKNIEDQKDVLQDIFIKAYKNLNDFDTSLSFSSWLYRIAHNESINWYRKQSVRPEGHLIASGDDVLNLLKDDDKNQEVSFDIKINADEVARALNRIDLKYQEVLVLRYFEAKEYDEISDILKIPIGTVGTLIARGKAKLKIELNPKNLRI
jgi:RNA polymerase sigma-70 factor (ECF subfamily)